MNFTTQSSCFLVSWLTKKWISNFDTQVSHQVGKKNIVRKKKRQSCLSISCVPWILLCWMSSLMELCHFFLLFSSSCNSSTWKIFLFLWGVCSIKSPSYSCAPWSCVNTVSILITSIKIFGELSIINFFMRLTYTIGIVILPEIGEFSYRYYAITRSC